MGCTGSKEEETGGGGGDGGKKGEKNGGGGASSAISDPRIPMTARQKFSIVASWKGIHRALESTGVSMFVRMFKENEEILALFDKFKHLDSREKQEESTDLQEHATMVMTALDNAMAELDNPDEFVHYLEGVGASHRRIPGLKKDFFWKIEKPFLEAVKETLGDRYTENMETIYKIAIQLILQTLVNGFEKQ